MDIDVNLHKKSVVIFRQQPLRMESEVANGD